MKIPVLKPEWIIDCESKKRRLPEADYIWDFTQTLPTGETVTAADVLAQAISNGLIISPANETATASTTAAPKSGKRARDGGNDADDSEVKDEDEEEEKPKTKKTKTAAKAPKGKAATAKKAATPAPTPPTASSAANDEADDGEPAEGQFAKKKDIVIPIDEFCPLQGYQVYVDPDSGMIYDASLNQSNATHNNNKFYRDQVSKNASRRLV
jgi:poly [ADP-ribose] polymerase